MTAQNQQQFSAESWQPMPDFSGRQPAASLLSWLTETGLLTVRMRAQCTNAFRLDVINDIHARAGDTDLHRQVILWCDKQPCIYAETCIPMATVSAHPWLRELGDEPLGERLQSQRNVTRSEFVYTTVSHDSLPEKIVTYGAAELWARRSDFYIGDDTLTVTEIFLPGVILCGSNSIE